MNIRGSRNGKAPNVGSKIPFRCSFCKKRLILGKSASAIVKMNYQLFDIEDEVLFCDRCMDVFTDMMQYGPRVLHDIRIWKRKSRVVRMSVIREDLYCFSCLGNADTHVFVKFDNLRVPGSSDVYSTKRVCARCAISFMQMMLNSKTLKRSKLPFHEEKEVYNKLEDESYEF